MRVHCVLGMQWSHRGGVTQANIDKVPASLRAGGGETQQGFGASVAVLPTGAWAILRGRVLCWCRSNGEANAELVQQAAAQAAEVSSSSAAAHKRELHAVNIGEPRVPALQFKGSDASALQGSGGCKRCIAKEVGSTSAFGASLQVWFIYAGSASCQWQTPYMPVCCIAAPTT